MLLLHAKQSLLKLKTSNHTKHKNYVSDVVVFFPRLSFVESNKRKKKKMSTFCYVGVGIWRTYGVCRAVGAQVANALISPKPHSLIRTEESDSMRCKQWLNVVLVCGLFRVHLFRCNVDTLSCNKVLVCRNKRKFTISWHAHNTHTHTHEVSLVRAFTTQYTKQTALTKKS